MEEFEKEHKQVNNPKTFTVPLSFNEIKVNLPVNTNTSHTTYKEQIINKAIKYHLQGNITKAIKYYQSCLNQDFNDHRVFSNYGAILQDLGNFKEAELLQRKAIKLKPNFSNAYSNLGNVLKDLGRLQDAELYTRKAIELNPNFAEAYSNLGNILRDLGKLQEAELLTRKAIELEPNFAHAHSNLGNILKDLGKLHQAEFSLRRAIELKPDFAEAKINLEAVLRKKIPRWHIPMINDHQRNNAYLKAINLAVKKNDYVLEIGTGSGLLSMMAIDAGAKKVVTCESNTSISRIAKKIISKNGYQDQVKVINNKSTELNIGNQLSQKADLIISEIFSSELVGEGVQPSIVDAKKRLLKENGKMIPESGEIKFALITGNSEIEEQCFTGKINSYDLSDFNEITGTKFNLQLKGLISSFLSNENVAFTFDFYSTKVIKKKEKVIEIPVIKSGTCIGITTWIKVKVFRNIYLENNPSNANKFHWINPIYTFNKPLKVSKGNIIKIKATLFEDNVWFELI